MIEKLRTWIQELGGWLFPRRAGYFTLRRCEEQPEKLVKQTVYLLGEKKHEWAVAFVCPCGCQQVLMLNLLQQEGRPKWTVCSDWRGRVTIAPSVWRHVGCRSHFFVRSGRIQWCGKNEHPR